MEQEETTTRDLVLRMIMRCNKVRKHKPKSVRVPQVSVEGEESPDFIEQLERKRYSPSQVRRLRGTLQKLASDN